MPFPVPNILHGRWIHALIAACVALAAGKALAQSPWPERPVQFVVPFPAGGAVDVAARADGYTLGFVTHGPLVIQPHLMKDLPYKRDDLVPVCQVFASQYVLASAPTSRIASLGDLIAASKAGKLSYGFGGVGTRQVGPESFHTTARQRRQASARRREN